MAKLGQLEMLFECFLHVQSNVFVAGIWLQGKKLQDNVLYKLQFLKKKEGGFGGHEFRK